MTLLAVGTLAAAGASLEDGQRAGRSSPRPKATGAGAPAVLTLAWSEAPTSLDPAFATSRSAANLALNLFDPLVRLDAALTPVPTLAAGWEVSADGKAVTFLLRREARWTNGDPVTAHDFVYAWKRVLSPALDSPMAEELFAIRGAAAYHACAAGSCARLADAVGVTAAGDHRLVVRLASRQPWFVARTAQAAFLPVHRATVERFGKRWASPKDIVTNGAFALERAGGGTITLVGNSRWRNADGVALDRVDGRVIEDDRARLDEFDAGHVLALDGGRLPTTDMPALRERREYESYPALATSSYAFNLLTVPDVHQRRAMSLAVDRRALIDNVAQGGELPAFALIPQTALGVAGAEDGSRWAPPDGDLAAARAALDEATVVNRRLTLLHVDGDANRRIARALQAAWRDLGIETTIRSRPEAAYLGFRGPLSSRSVDLYQRDWAAAFPDPVSGLAGWTCKADENKTNFCNHRFDALVQRAGHEPSQVARSDLYTRAEEILVGEEGALPFIPLFWETYPNLESLHVRETFAINPLGQIDLSRVELR